MQVAGHVNGDKKRVLTSLKYGHGISALHGLLTFHWNTDTFITCQIASR